MDWTEDLEFGHPVIDRQHREIAALTDTLRDLFKEDQAAPRLVAAMTEYCRLLSDHFALERGLMERLPPGQCPGHIASHCRNHREMLDFVQQAIEDLSSGGDTRAITAAIPTVFAKLRHNIIFDDAELSRQLIAAKILAPTKP